MFANRATVLVGEAVPPESLDEGELRSRIEDADARLSESEEGSGAHAQAQREKERAEAFLEVAGSDARVLRGVAEEQPVSCQPQGAGLHSA